MNTNFKLSRTIWITGLSGAGKTTLGGAVVSLLRNKNLPVIFLDGDQLRDVLGLSLQSNTNHSRQSRLLLAMKYSKLCKIISEQKITVVIATISMFREVHDWNKANLSNYFEVFLKVPLKELRRRDPKKIYHRYELGEINNIAGLDLKVDDPKTPDLLFDFNLDKKYTIEYMANKIIEKL